MQGELNESLMDSSDRWKQNNLVQIIRKQAQQTCTPRTFMIMPLTSKNASGNNRKEHDGESPGGWSKSVGLKRCKLSLPRQNGWKLSDTFCCCDSSTVWSLECSSHRQGDLIVLFRCLPSASKEDYFPLPVIWVGRGLGRFLLAFASICWASAVFVYQLKCFRSLPE